MPHAVLMPAPVNTTILLQPLTWKELHQVVHKPILNTCTVQQSKETEGAHKISKLVYLSLQLFLCVEQLWCAQLTAEVLVVG